MSVTMPCRSRHREALLRKLVRMRGDTGLTQTALADRLGLTQSEVSKFERGERALDVLQLRAWLQALGTALAPFADELDRELDGLDAAGPERHLTRETAGGGVGRVE